MTVCKSQESTSFLREKYNSREIYNRNINDYAIKEASSSSTFQISCPYSITQVVYPKKSIHI
jgi:hypothetical protein